MTALEARPPATGSGPADLRRTSRLVAALLLPLGPAAVAVLRFVLPYFTTDDPATIVRSVAAHPGQQSLVLWLAFVAVLTLVPAVLGVARLTRRRAPRLTAAAVILAVPGYLSLGWLTSSDLLVWAGVRQDVDPRALTPMLEAAHPTSNIAAAVFVLGHVLGTVLLGLAMWRSRAVPRWAVVLTIVAQPLHFVAAVIVLSPALDLGAWGMNAVGFAAAAVAALRLPDDEWDLAPQPRAVP